MTKKQSILLTKTLQLYDFHLAHFTYTTKKSHGFLVQFGWFTSKPLVPIRIMCEEWECFVPQKIRLRWFLGMSQLLVYLHFPIIQRRGHKKGRTSTRSFFTCIACTCKLQTSPLYLLLLVVGSVLKKQCIHVSLDDSLSFVLLNCI